MQRGSNYMYIGGIPQRTVNVAQLSCNATKTLSDTPINVQLTSYDNMFNDNTVLHNIQCSKERAEHSFSKNVRKCYNEKCNTFPKAHTLLFAFYHKDDERSIQGKSAGNNAGKRRKEEQEEAQGP